MNQLSIYIQSEIRQIRNQVERTPPKKPVSLKRLKQLVNTAPILHQHKAVLKKSIRELQTAIKVNSSPINYPQGNKQHFQNKGKVASILQLGQNNSIMKQRVCSKLRKEADEATFFLRQQYQKLKKIRQQKDRYLQELIIKVQRQDRMDRNRQKSAQLQHQKRQMQQKYMKRQEDLRNLRAYTLQAVKNQQVQTTQRLMNQYYAKVRQNRSK